MTACMISAVPRRAAKPLPTFPNPAARPEGSLPPLVLNFFSEVPDGIELALGTAPRRDTAAFLRAIREAGNRTIICKINCAGGDPDSTLAIATALLEHPFAVTAKIVGRCSSAAAFIALAADTRVISEAGYVLLHRSMRLCTLEQWENVKRLPPSEQQAINDSLNDIDDASAVLLRDRLGVSEQLARGWLAEDRKLSSLEALQRGFVHAVDSLASLDPETGVNHAVEFTAVALLSCPIPNADPYLSNVLLMGYEGDNGSIGSPG
jgi:ATP-dependent protease ClpP protease subunit